MAKMLYILYDFGQLRTLPWTASPEPVQTNLLELEA